MGFERGGLRVFEYIWGWLGGRLTAHVIAQVSVYAVARWRVRIRVCYDASLTCYPSDLREGFPLIVRPIPESTMLVITRSPQSAICLHHHAVF